MMNLIADFALTALGVGLCLFFAVLPWMIEPG